LPGRAIALKKEALEEAVSSFLATLVNQHPKAATYRHLKTGHLR